MSLNQSIIMGNLVRDPEVKAIPSTSVCEFTLAVNERYKDRETVSFIECKAFGDKGETIAKHFRRGKPIIVIGKLRQESWESNGAKRSKLVILVDNFAFTPRDNSGHDSGNRQQQPRQQGAAEQLGFDGGETPPASDDIPF